MKKNILLKMGILMCVFCLVGCGDKEESWEDNTASLGNIEQNIEDPDKDLLKNEEPVNTETSSEKTEIKEENSNNEFDAFIGKTIEDLVNSYPNLEENGYMSMNGEYTFYLSDENEKYRG